MKSVFKFRVRLGNPDLDFENLNPDFPIERTLNVSDCITLSTLFSTFQALKTWFELLRVNLHRSELRGNKNYFELAGGSSYRGFELPRIKL